MPSSVTTAVTRRAGVTSNTGLRTLTPAGTTRRPPLATTATSSAARSSMGMRAPESMARSSVVGGARGAVRADGAAGGEILGPQRLRLGERIALARDRVRDPVQRRAQVDGRGTRRADGAQRRAQDRRRGLRAPGERRREGRGAPDGGRATHLHLGDGARDVFPVVVRRPASLVRKPPLIEQHDGAVAPEDRGQDVRMLVGTLALWQRDGRHHAPRRRFRMSLTAFGLALPPVSFMTAPTKKPMSLGLSLRRAASSGWAATTRLHASSSAPTSETWFKPSAFTMSAAVRRSAHMRAKTSLASLPESVPASMRATSTPASCGERPSAVV